MYQITRRVAALLAFVAGTCSASTVQAAPKSSEENVKITAKVDKDVVTLTVEVAKGWHLYANPVGNPDLASSQTVVTFMDGGKAVAAKVVYPEGKVTKDPVVGDYRIYEGTITIKATLPSVPAGPLEATVAVQTCTETMCLLPAKVKVKVK